MYPNLSSICVPIIRTSSFLDISQAYATISAALDFVKTCNVFFNSSNFGSERAISIIGPAPLFTKSRKRPAFQFPMKLRLLLLSFLQTFSSFCCLRLLSHSLSINLRYYHCRTSKSLFAKRDRQKRGQQTIHLW